MFYNFPGGLRFELSEGNGGSPLDEVLTALRKATAICDDVFVNDDKILPHLQAFAPASRFGLRKMIRELPVAGILIPAVRDVRGIACRSCFLPFTQLDYAQPTGVVKPELASQKVPTFFLISLVWLLKYVYRRSPFSLLRADDADGTSLPPTLYGR